ncbi:hypothetical protein PR048_016144 [Dryococelus australis]|uniref:Uncharacterized protein n=1 Tax=Dryococelus australis TaxID=614101 RepID=A0ABQ9HJ71_9NEOP|nr:hypothetical protein PR048_016144 [Dryococelus australis]
MIRGIHANWQCGKTTSTRMSQCDFPPESQKILTPCIKGAADTTHNNTQSAMQTLETVRIQSSNWADIEGHRQTMPYAVCSGYAG